MDRILHEGQGSIEVEMQRRVDMSMSEWKLEPMSFMTERVTFAWRDIIGHPFVMILRAQGWANQTDGRVTYQGIPGPLDLKQKCNDAKGVLGLCWSLPSFNVFQAFNMTNRSRAEPGAREYLRSILACVLCVFQALSRI